MFKFITTGSTITPAGHQGAQVTPLLEQLLVMTGRDFLLVKTSRGSRSAHSSNKLGNSCIHRAPLSWMNQAGGGLLWWEKKTAYCVSGVVEWTGGGGRESLPRGNLRVQSRMEPIWNPPANSWLSCLEEQISLIKKLLSVIYFLCRHYRFVFMGNLSFKFYLLSIQISRSCMCFCWQREVRFGSRQVVSLSVNHW